MSYEHSIQIYQRPGLDGKDMSRRVILENKKRLLTWFNLTEIIKFTLFTKAKEASFFFNCRNKLPKSSCCKDEDCLMEKRNIARERPARADSQRWVDPTAKFTVNQVLPKQYSAWWQWHLDWRTLPQLHDRGDNSILPFVAHRQVYKGWAIVVFSPNHGYNMGHNGIWHKGKSSLCRKWLIRMCREDSVPTCMTPWSWCRPPFAGPGSSSQEWSSAKPPPTSTGSPRSAPRLAFPFPGKPPFAAAISLPCWKEKPLLVGTTASMANIAPFTSGWLSPS